MKQVKQSERMNKSTSCVLTYKSSSMCNWSYVLLLLVTIQVSGAQQYFKEAPTKNIASARSASVTIPCKVVNRQGRCLWLHDDRIITPSQIYKFDDEGKINGDCSMTIDKLTLEDEGTWQCQVTSVTREKPLQSDKIFLQVLVQPGRPSIKQTHPYTRDLQVHVGADNQIECSVSDGNPQPRISWLLNGVNITQYADSEAMKDERTKAWSVRSKLTRYPIQRNENKHNLTCFSEHETGNQNESTRLDVLYRPVVTVTKSRYTVVDGESFELKCDVDANPRAHSVGWRKQGSTTTPYSSTFDGISAIYNLRANRDLHNSTLECVATSEKGEAEPALVHIEVQYQPEIKSQSSNTEIETGQTVSLSCESDGNPTPKIKWIHVDPLTGRETEVHNSGRDQGVLKIENATYRDEGVYYCDASNIINDRVQNVRSKKMTLDVHGLPALLQEGPYSIVGTRGGQSQVKLQFCSDPPPSRVVWRIGSIELNALQNSNAQIPSRYTVKPMETLKSTYHLDNATSKCYDSTILIRETDANDERDYSLIIENLHGTQEGVVKLRVVTPISPTLLIAITLSIIIVIIIISIMLFMMKKKRKDSDSIRDHEEAKEDAQALSQVTSSGKKITGPANGANGQMKDAGGDVKTVLMTNDVINATGKSNELVYANLDFDENTPKSNTIDVTTLNKLNDSSDVPVASIESNDTSSKIKSVSVNNKSNININNGNNSNTPSSRNNKPIIRSKPKAATRNSSNKLQSNQQVTSNGSSNGKQNVSLNKNQHEKRNANSTEYASIAFSDKTDL